MKKFFRWLFILIIILIAVVLIAGLILPKAYHVERSIIIKADNESVYSNINSLKAMTNWSPWVDYDPDLKKEFEGIDGEVGSKYSWTGNEDVGKGYQEILSITENQIKTKIVFIEPMESEAIGTIDLKQTEEGIEVTWGFDGSTPYPLNVMSLFMNMDEMIGEDFEKGLAKLDSICKLNPVSDLTKYSNYTISEIEYGPKTFVGFKEVIKFENIQSFYAKYFGALFGFYIPMGVEIDGYSSGIFFSYNEEKGEAEMMAAIPVKAENIELPEGAEIIEAKGKALFIEYVGPYNGSGEAHYAMEDYMKENNLELNKLVIEEYVTDPGTEPDTSKWITNIIYLIK